MEIKNYDSKRDLAVNMEMLLKVDVLFFSVILLVLMRIGMLLQRKGLACSEKIFHRLTLAVMTVIIIDLISVVVDGQAGEMARIVNYTSNTILSVLQPLPTILWLCYIDYHIFRSRKRIRRRLYYLLPLSIGLVLSLLSLKNGIVFTINADNIYHRGIGIYIIGFVNLLTVLYSWILLFIGRKEIELKVTGVVVAFTLFPITGGIIQLLNYGVSLLWPLMALGIVLVYIVMELNKDSRDHLTGLLNRQQIGDWIEYRINNYGCSGPFSLVIVDIDNFYEIKSKWGKKSSDQALLGVAHSLGRIVKKKDKVARFGESKFILIMETGKVLGINEFLARLLLEIEKENRYRDSFPIEFSSGYAVYHPSYYKDIVAFFEAATEILQKVKHSRQRRNRASGIEAKKLESVVVAK